MSDTLIVTLVALGIVGGFLYLAAGAMAIIDWVTTWFNIWSLVRAESKTNMALIIDRIHRGWWNMLPTIWVKSDEGISGTWRLMDRYVPQWDKMQEPDK
jgi:hypothetical protein